MVKRSQWCGFIVIKRPLDVLFQPQPSPLPEGWRRLSQTKRRNMPSTRAQVSRHACVQPDPSTAELQNETQKEQEVRNRSKISNWLFHFFKLFLMRMFIFRCARDSECGLVAFSPSPFSKRGRKATASSPTDATQFSFNFSKRERKTAQLLLKQPQIWRKKEKKRRWNYRNWVELVRISATACVYGGKSFQFN